MKSKTLFLLLLCGTFCFGQSVLTTPIDSTQSTSGLPAGQGPSATAAQGAAQAPGQNTSGTYVDIITGQRVPESRAQNQPGSSTRIAGPLTQKSEFEQFAEDATGHRLPVYGRQLFDEVPTTFAPVEHVPVPENYVIGPGDELMIRAWGKIDLDSRVTVDRNGQIYLPRVGVINVAGLRFEQTEAYIRTAIRALFKDFELNVALGQLRSIQIFVLGNARQPGAYTVSSLSTLVNALFASGGPSATGSMRHIQLRRAGHVVTEFDIYDLAQRGDKSHDVQLLPGDVIYIPPIGPQVAISGDVNVPGIYELKGATSIAAALEGAGGVTTVADTSQVFLERIENHSSRHIEQFGLDESGLKRQLEDGDLLRINPLSPKFEDVVTLRGNVAQPGRFTWKEGMRVSDLIPSREFLITRDYWNRQNQEVPRNPSRPFAKPMLDESGNPVIDRFGNPVPELPDEQEERSGNGALSQYGSPNGIQYGSPNGVQNQSPNGIQYGNSAAQQNVPLNQYGGVNGSPQTNMNGAPQTNQFGQTRTGRSGASQNDPFAVSQTGMIETIGQNKAEINWDYAVIERLDVRDLSTRLVPFSLANAIDNPSSTDNEILRAGDVVTVFSRADLELPTEKHASFVRIGGEVNAPGVYRVDPGESLRDVVKRAGGLTSHSYLYASRLTRVSARRAQEQELQQYTDQMQKELVTKLASGTQQSGQSATDQQAQFAMMETAVAKLSSIKPTGRVVLEMKPESKVMGDIPAFPLEDGDTFYIPTRPGTVQVTGAVYNPNAFRHEPGKRLYAYLNDAGGATREADRKRIFLIRADGTVVSHQSSQQNTHVKFERTRLQPGDAIVVPERIMTTSKIANIAQAMQMVSEGAMTLAYISLAK